MPGKTRVNNPTYIVDTPEREGHVTTCTCGVSRGPGSMFTQIHPLKFIQNILNIVAVRFFKS